MKNKAAGTRHHKKVRCYYTGCVRHVMRDRGSTRGTEFGFRGGIGKKSAPIRWNKFA